MTTVFFDLETSGLDPKTHEIIQLAAVAVDGIREGTWDEIETFEAKLDFNFDRASAKALHVNSYDPDVWDEHAIEPRSALVRFSYFLRRHATLELISRKGTPYTAAQLGGHNIAAFDVPFLAQAFKDHGIAFLPASHQGLDTLQLATWWRSFTPAAKPANLQLKTLADWFEVPIAGAHDALVDVRATIGVAKALSAHFPRVAKALSAQFPPF